jgi:vacuolar-type H+-ATPase subunit F/Vma7
MSPSRSVADVPCVLADRLTAAAWRLAGARVVEVPEALPAHELRAAFDAACASGSRVLLAAGVAARLPADALARRVRGSAPLVAVVEAAIVADAVLHARRVLGVAS